MLRLFHESDLPVLFRYEMNEECADVKRAYSMIDRLSYLDWGLRSEDKVSGKRTLRLASDIGDDFGGEVQLQHAPPILRREMMFLSAPSRTLSHCLT